MPADWLQILEQCFARRSQSNQHALSNNARTARKVECIDPDHPRLRLDQGDTNQIAKKHLANIAGDRSDNLAQIEIRCDLVRETQEQAKPFIFAVSFFMHSHVIHPVTRAISLKL